MSIISGSDIQYVHPTSPTISAKGMLTGTMIRMLDNSAIEVTAMYYDDRGRVVQSRANNRLNGYDYDLYHYSFTGQVLNHRHVHKTSLITSELIENYRFTYDHADRLISTYHKLNTRAEVLLSELVYDELGRVSQKRLHSGGETIEYTYNIRNWTKSITSNRFSQTLYYQDALDGKPVYYNGNISAIKWGVGATQDKKYHFSYDGLNRMTYAAYSPDNMFDEKVEQYDKHGNILSLKRSGWVQDWSNEEPILGYVDYMTMTYNGNQLVNADDMVEEIFNQSPNDFYNVWDENIQTEYLYDANGNQYADLNKGIAWIKYNLLNLPEKIQFQNGNKIEYLYDASGVKRQAKWAYSSTTVFIPLNGTDQENNSLQGTITTQYCGNYIYEQGKVKRIITTEGYITTNNLPMQFMYMWRYNYSLRDYQGNTRQTLYGNTLSGNQTVLYASSSSTIDYYPFGMEMTTPEGNYTSGTNPYLYNGKEIDRMHGLNQYDYGARWRDGALPAWTTVDPLAEKYYSISPYAYCTNNPVLFVDPDGMEFDTSNMTPEELEKYNNEVEIRKQQSKLFNTMYTYLENSKNKYIVKFGQTTSDGSEPFDGIFTANKEGGGTVTFSEALDDLKGSVISEELFHAYQYDNKGSYESGEFNVEFEAKVFSTAVGIEFVGYTKYEGMIDFQTNMYMGNYGNENQIISPEAVISETFINKYKSSANSYATYNRENNIGNIHYKKNTTVAPYSLQKVVNEAYKKK